MSQVRRKSKVTNQKVNEKPDLILYDANDMGNAQRFLDAAGKDVCYSVPDKQWYWYDGTCWHADQTKRVERMALATLDASYANEIEYFQEMQDNGYYMEQQIKESKKRRVQAGNLQTLQNCLHMAEMESAILPTDFDRDPYLFHSADKIIDLRTMKVVEPHREYFITKTAGAPYAHAVDAPVWNRFVMECCEGDMDLYRYLQRAAGYSVLSGEIDAQKIFCLYGPGRNGKSLFINTLAKIAGEYACKIDAGIISLTKRGDRDNDTSKELYRMRGSRFVYTSEFNKNTVLNEAFVKSITDGGNVSCRPLYGACIEYMPTYTVWFSTNNAPQLQGMDDGIKRRFVLIPFTHQVSEADADYTLADKFTSEASGILNWLLVGYTEYKKHGLQTPHTVQEATEAYTAEQDLFAMFVNEHYTIDENGKMYAKAIYLDYTIWCKENGLTPVSMVVLSRELVRLGAVKKRANTGKVYGLVEKRCEEQIGA